MTTRDEILRAAREAGFVTGTRDYSDGCGGMPFVQSVATGNFLPELERFAAMIDAAARNAGHLHGLNSGLKIGAEQEREACEKLAQDISDQHVACDNSGPAIVAAIHARGQT